MSESVYLFFDKDGEIKILFIILLYIGFKNLLLVPLPEGLWFRD